MKKNKQKSPLFLLRKFFQFSLEKRSYHEVKARDGNERRPASDLFEKEEIEVLENLEKKVEGRTEKQKNLFKKDTLSWAAWIIARLGGWDVYCSSPLGSITLFSEDGY